MIDKGLKVALHTVYLSLGSNIGNRKRNMRDAVRYLEANVGTVLRKSDLLETEPWGFASPNLFINMCVCIETPLLPQQLLEVTQAIERKMGRTEKSVGEQYADRIIALIFCSMIACKLMSLTCKFLILLCTNAIL